MQTAYQQTNLRSLRDGFGIDTTPAENLSGPELDAWMNSAEDEWFLAAMQGMCSNRVPVPAGPITLPPVGGEL